MRGGRRGSDVCEQCGGRSDRCRLDPVWGVLCEGCGWRQLQADDRRDRHAGLTASMFGFAPGDDDPFDD